MSESKSESTEADRFVQAITFLTYPSGREERFERVRELPACVVEHMVAVREWIEGEDEEALEARVDDLKTTVERAGEERDATAAWEALQGARRELDQKRRGRVQSPEFRLAEGLASGRDSSGTAWVFVYALTFAGLTVEDFVTEAIDSVPMPEDQEEQIRRELPQWVLDAVKGRLDARDE